MTKGTKGGKDGGARAAAHTAKGTAARTAKGVARAAARTAKGGKGRRTDKGKKDIVRLRDWTREHRKDPVYRAKIRANAAAQRAQLKREAEIGRLAMKFFGLLGQFIEQAKSMGVAK